eukprot:scaffold8310_cov67-Isochrysis_galbana.AAC.1
MTAEPTAAAALTIAAAAAVATATANGCATIAGGCSVRSGVVSAGASGHRSVFDSPEEHHVLSCIRSKQTPHGRHEIAEELLVVEGDVERLT